MAKHTMISRRSTIRSGLAALAGGVTATAALAQTGDESTRLPKSRVHYQYTPNAQGSHCSICQNFVAPNACQIVAGGIAPNGYCLVFSPKDIDLNK